YGGDARGVGVQQDDPLVLVGDAQLAVGANHRVAGHAADLARLELLEYFFIRVAVEEHRAAQGDDDFLAAVADLDVGRTGNELFRLALAEGDGRQRQAIGVGVLLDLDHFADEDLVAVPDGPALLGLDAQAHGHREAQYAHTGDFQTGERQALDQLRLRQRQLHIFTQPTQGNFHGKNLLDGVADSLRE